MRFIALILLVVLIFPAHRAAAACVASDRACVIRDLIKTAEKIEKDHWRDQTYREIAKTLAAEGRYDDAINFIDKVGNPDTKAMTIRGIGMTAAEHGISADDYNTLFQALHSKAADIEHPPSHAIALTYIAMVQAFANDDKGAWKTAGSMDNDALRNKAYGETAEIQAERGKYAQAMQSIKQINSESFKNKAFSITSKIFADDGHYDHALGAAEGITNTYKRARALQYILDQQKPREQPHD
ncbi:MAG: hypothetical protein CL570_01370 [Alphaproteobacteria bacterium]|nr:hypothetical protein [Alphaproteobacteria bacterium]HCQ71147.1 hypothetical protein [Rhodospirillaceae bacterium]|tara:strand:- start:98085 stop:98807 length:723 start_codon:yes stop_codon:yes gene_type:complete